MTYLYGGLAAMLLAIGAWAAHLWDNHRYDKAQEAFTAYKAQVAIEERDAANAAREALQKQVDDAHRRDQENDQILESLHQKLDTAERDRIAARNAARSLLAEAGKGAGSCALPAPPDKPGTAPASGAPSLETVGDACSALYAQGRRNADRLDALISQVKGQL